MQILKKKIFVGLKQNNTVQEEEVLWILSLRIYM